jgi:hypothetical protein
MCGKPADGQHPHYYVSVSENGKWLGNLTPEGRSSRLKVYTMVLGEERAKAIASDINAEGKFKAKAVKW